MEGSIAGVFAPQPVPRGYAKTAGIGLVLRPEAFAANARDVAAVYDFVATQAPRHGELAMPVTAIAGEADTVVWTDVHSRAIAAEAQKGGSSPCQASGTCRTCRPGPDRGGGSRASCDAARQALMARGPPSSRAAGEGRGGRKLRGFAQRGLHRGDLLPQARAEIDRGVGLARPLAGGAWPSAASAASLNSGLKAGRTVFSSSSASICGIVIGRAK